MATPAAEKLLGGPRWWVLAGLGGFAAGLFAVMVGALVVVEGGLFDATATKPHMAVVAWSTHEAFTRSARLRARQVEPPPRFTAQQAAAGLAIYERDCVMCHGGPGAPRARWVADMTPTPPFLLDASKQWTPRQLNWIVGQGIKMTGMPGWRDTLSPAEIWDVVAFLEALPDMSPQDYLRAHAALKSAPVSSETNATAR